MEGFLLRIKRHSEIAPEAWPASNKNQNNRFRQALWIARALLMFGSIYPGRLDAQLRPQPEPTGQNPDDWIMTERDRARGLFNRLSRNLSAPQTQWTFPDKNQRKFKLDTRGNLTYDPRDANWQPILPDRNQADLHLSEAQALLNLGAYTESFLILRALRALGQPVFQPTTIESRIAKEATQLIQEQAKRTGYQEILRTTDPYLLFNNHAQATYVFNDAAGWRLQLPGRWRSTHRIPDFEKYQLLLSKHGRRTNTLFLKQNGLSITITDLIWKPRGALRNMGEWLHWLDHTRHLNAQQKSRLRFKRMSPDEVWNCNLQFDGQRILTHQQKNTTSSLKLTGSKITKKKFCLVTQSRIIRRQWIDGRSQYQAFRFLEYNFLSARQAFALHIRYVAREQANAVILLQYFMNAWRAPG